MTRPTTSVLAPFALLPLAAPAQELGSLPPTIVEAERVEDDPAAVSVLTRESLDLFQTESFSELSGLVPGFHVVASDSRGYGQVVAMRGSTNTLFFGPPALGLTIDDLPLGDAYTYPSELLQLDQVRVHRGPHGPYFGRNAPAGMVEMFTPRPGDQFRNELELELGTFDHLRVSGLSSGPLGDCFSYSVQLFHDQRDGYLTDLITGDRIDDREATGGLFNLFWQPSDDFELRFRVFAEQVNDGAQRLTSMIANPNRYTVYADAPGATDLERYQFSIHSRKDFSYGTLETISSYQTWDLDPSLADLDLMPPAFGLDARSDIVQSQDLVSNEIRYSAGEGTPLRWRAGLFQLWTDNVGDASRQLFPGYDETTRFDIEQLNLAAFGNLTWQAGEALAVDAGLRVDYHESEMDRVKDSFFSGFPVGSAPVVGKRDEWFVSPVLGLTWEVHPAVSLFYRSALGNKPGGFSAYSDNPVVAEFERETNWSNELGFEYDCPGYDLRFGLRGFWDQIDDYQFNESVPGTTDFVVLNAEEVVSRGVELDAAWAPVGGLTVRGSIGYVDAEFDRYTDLTGLQLDGNKVPFVPEYTGSLGVRYDFDFGFYAQTSMRVAGRTRFDAVNSSSFTEDSYVTWDAELGYGTEHFNVALYGRNLLDEQYYTFINPSIAAGTPGVPQIFGVRLKSMF